MADQIKSFSGEFLRAWRVVLVVGMLLSTIACCAQWVEKSSGLNGGKISALGIAGSNIYAGTIGHGIFLSTNNGASWTAVNSGITGEPIVTALVANASGVFAANLSGGVFFSTNNGTDWTQVNTGLTDLQVYALFVNGINLFAGTQTGGVFRSTDNGASWVPVNSGLTNLNVNAFTVIGSNLFAGTVGGGVFLSTNNGTSWVAVNTGLLEMNVRALVANGANLFAGTNGGVYLSTNNGTSWTAVNAGLTNPYLKALAANGINLFAATDGGGVFLSTNNGASWTPVNTGITNPLVYALAVSGSNLFAGTLGDGVFLSTDNGANWAPAVTGLPYADGHAFATIGSDLFVGTEASGVFRSTDDGTSWSPVNSGLPGGAGVYAFAANGSNLFAGTNSSGVYLSTNNGANWAPANGGITNQSVQALVRIGANLFAGTNGSGVFTSSDNGTSWTQVNVGLTNLTVRALSVYGVNLFAGTWGGGVFLSTNNGASWTQVNTGITDPLIWSLAVNGSNLFAGTYTGEVFLSTDNGTSWAVTADSGPNGIVRSLVVHGGNLYAGAIGGVFLTRNNGVTWTSVSTLGLSPFVFSLAISGTNLFAGTNSGVWSRPLSDFIPSISSISPTSGPVGSSVTLTGTGFDPIGPNNVVYFGATQSTVTAATETELTVNVPAGATYQPITVTVNGLTCYSNEDFNVTYGGVSTISFDSKVDFVAGANVSTGTIPGAVAIADFNLDGKPDVVLASPGADKITVFRNASTPGTITSGTFASGIDLVVGITPRAVAVGDLDGDGKLDIVVTNFNDNSISTLRNTTIAGSISFEKYDYSADNNPNGVAIGDIDGDGKPEIVVTTQLPSLSIYKNTSIPGVIDVTSFQPRVNFPQFNFSYTVVIRDMDGDSKKDIVTSSLSPNNFISVYRNISTLGVIDINSLDVRVNIAASLDPYALSIADFDGDGRRDVATANLSANNISIFRNTGFPGTVTFDPRTNFAVGSGPTGICFTDFDLDGKPDLAVTEGNVGSALVMKNSNTGGTVVAGSLTSSASLSGLAAPFAVASGDLDLDGKPEIVVANNLASNTISVYHNTTLATDPTAQSLGPITFSNITPDSFDGAFPIAVGNPDGYLVLMSEEPPDFLPVDGREYAIDFFGVGTTPGGKTIYVVQNSGTPGFSIDNIVPPVPLYFKVYSFNGSGPTINYLTTSPLSGSQAPAGPLASEPSVQASSIIITQPFASTLRLNWTNGDGTSRLVLGREVTVNEAPADGTTYTPSASFSSGDDLSNGNYVVYKGSGSTVDVTDVQTGVTYQFFVFEFNGTGGAENYLTSTAIGNPAYSDQVPPVVANSTPGTIAPNTNLVVTANFTDAGAGVDYAELEYRQIAGAAPNDFITVDMNNISGDTYEYTIPAIDVTELGIEYKFLVTDFAANDNSSDQTLYRTRIRHEGGLGIPYASPGRAISNYRIISVPLELDNKSINSAIGDELESYDPTKWIMYRYNGERFVELSGATQLQIGYGYWLLTPNTALLNSGPGTTANAGVTSPFQMTLAPGWNQIGNPYNFDISWQDVLDANPTFASSLSDQIRVFRGTKGDDDVLSAFEGGFVSNTGLTMVIDIPVEKNMGIQGGRKGEVEKVRTAIDQPNWEILFNLEQGETEYKLGGLGMHPEAAVGFDHFDDYNSPRFIEYLEVKFPKERVGMTYTKDIVPTAANFVWPFTVESNIAEGPITIGWDNSYFGSGKEIFLVDLEDHQAINMREEENYRFSASLSRPFKVVYGDAEFVQNEILPGQPVLFAPYPNPFSERVTIGYSLPKAVVTQGALLDIYNSQGARVSSMDLPAQPGEGSWEWVSQQAPGVYFSRLRVGDQIVIRKLIKR